MEIIQIIKQSSYDTIMKHYSINNNQQYSDKEYEFIGLCLNDIFDNNRFSGLTSTNGARENVRNIGTDALFVELIRGAYLSYTIETRAGYARELREVGSNGYPETTTQAVNYVYNQLGRLESPSLVYSELLRNKNLTKLLVNNYASLAAYSTKEQRDFAYAVCPEHLNEKLTTLDNLQQYLISNNLKTLNIQSGNQR